MSDRGVAGRGETARHPTEEPSLTQAEHAALDLLAMFTSLLAKEVIGNGPSRNADLTEAVTYIHALQGMVMSQAAARAYPDRYRLLGEALCS